MTKGILLYCFDTEQTQYHLLLKKCVDQIEKYLKLPITVVTNQQTYLNIKDLTATFRVVENETGNTRFYRGQNVPWHNMERVNAYEHSPYDQTILMDIDYFVFSNELIKYFDTDYDYLLHDKVTDITGKNSILGKNESTLPIVWATVIIFKKTKKSQLLFDAVKLIQKNYSHYRNLYRIKHRNYRNDFAFAIAIHQLNGMIDNKNFIPSPMFMLPHEQDILEFDDTGVLFKYDKKIGILQETDVHILDKEFVNV